MSLPTYEQAVARPLLIEFVVPYLTAHELGVASRVCRSWEKTCTPILWRDPVKILAKQALPYSRTFNFLESALQAREERRQLLHTLDFRPLIALRSKYPRDYDLHLHNMNGLHILHVCYQLHHVKVIILDGILDWSSSSCYEYVTTGLDAEDANTDPESSGSSMSSPYRNPSSESAMALRPGPSPNLSPNSTANRSGNKAARQSTPPAHHDDAQHSLPFRPLLPVLLSLKGCSELDGPQTICFACFRTQELTFLDMSFTNCNTVHSTALSNLPLPNLRILKLRGTRLTDNSIPKFNLRRGGNVWSLDVRDNLLTDKSIDILYGWLLPSLPMQFTDHTIRNYHPPPSYWHDYESSRDDTNGIIDLRSDTEDDFIRYLATNPHMNMEGDPLLRRTGLTNLYLSGNKISSLGIRKLVGQTNRLNVLDIGTVRDPTDFQFRSRHAIAWDQMRSVSGLKLSTNYNIKSLRVHHSIVTCMPTVSLVAGGNENDNTPTSFSSRHLCEAEKVGRTRVEKDFAFFLPMHNSLIETLVLTGIPTKSYGFLIEKLLAFLDACRTQEKELSEARVTTHRRAPEVLPGLKTLRLEFLPPDDMDSMDPSHRGSVSGDPDADAFSAASNIDFSFFADPDRMELPLHPLTADSQTGTEIDTGVREDTPLQDVIEELRKARREAGENKWGGNLELVLPQPPTPSDSWREGIF